ncbi:MAG: hypothetical protein IT563_10965 [Alphaproteobacteria bacterium]|nr:hypothetical protein [Alphaproteobacteria bacterium]
MAAKRRARFAMLLSRFFHPVVRNPSRAAADKRFFLRLGPLPPEGRSQNRINGGLEAGVSCYEAVLCHGTIYIMADELRLEATRVKLAHARGKDVSALAGKRRGTGSDGEPVVKVEAVKPLRGFSVGRIRVARRRGLRRLRAHMH